MSPAGRSGARPGRVRRWRWPISRSTGPPPPAAGGTPRLGAGGAGSERFPPPPPLPPQAATDTAQFASLLGQARRAAPELPDTGFKDTLPFQPPAAVNDPEPEAGPDSAA